MWINHLNSSRMVIKLVAVLFCMTNISLAQLPAVCTSPSNFHEQICCPEPFVGAGPCGSWLAFPRGKCVYVDNDQATTNVRGNWPHYYSKICECRPPFGNFDCGECAHGFSGTSCDKKVIRTRNLLNHLSRNDVEYFINALYMAKSFPSRYVVIINETKPGTVPPMKVASLYDVFVWVHYYISKESYTYDFGHGGPGFPVWHRHLLMWLERELRWMLGGDINFSVPFWDWSSEKHRMYPFQENVFGASDGKGGLVGNFANWSIICNDSLSTGVICDPTVRSIHLARFRNQEVYNGNYSKWPRREEICEALAIPTYDSAPYDSGVVGYKSFRNFMEGFYAGNESCNDVLFDCISQTSRLQLHNQVHNMLNGTLTNVPIASNDPLFIVHHAFVDYILEMWIRRHHGDFKPPPNDISAAKGHNFNDVIVPFLPLARVHEMLVESSVLGWTYESLPGLELDYYSCHSMEVYNDSSVLYPDTTGFQTSFPMSLQAELQQHLNEDRMHGTISSIFNPLNSYDIGVSYGFAPYRQEFIPLDHVCIFIAENFNIRFFEVPPSCHLIIIRSVNFQKVPFLWLENRDPDD